MLKASMRIWQEIMEPRRREMAKAKMRFLSLLVKDIIRILHKLLTILKTEKCSWYKKVKHLQQIKWLSYRNRKKVMLRIPSFKKTLSLWRARRHWVPRSKESPDLTKNNNKQKVEKLLKMLINLIKSFYAKYSK